MRDDGGYARRIEDQYAVGIFDMIIIPRGLPVFFAEVKMVTNNVFGPTPRQMIELSRLADVAGNACHAIPVMIGFQDHIYYFHKPQLKIDKRDCFSVTTSEMPFHRQITQYFHSIRGLYEPQYKAR
jgi:hypothetical protein